MSGSGVNGERQSEDEDPDGQTPAGYTLRAANAVLTVDLAEVPVTRVSQFVVGWLRAAFEQSRIIAMLTASGLGHAAAPNRRAFWEVTIRLLWLRDIPQPDRASAADTMLDHERKTEIKTDEYMRTNGLRSDIDVAEMEAFVLNVTKDKLRSEATNLTHAVKGTDTNLWMVYRLWREDSTWTHATGFLAGSYAPAKNDDTMGIGRPPHIDANLEAHNAAAAIMSATVADLLLDEGTPSDRATAPMLAYLQAN